MQKKNRFSIIFSVEREFVDVFDQFVFTLASICARFDFNWKCYQRQKVIWKCNFYSLFHSVKSKRNENDFLMRSRQTQKCLNRFWLENVLLLTITFCLRLNDGHCNGCPTRNERVEQSMEIVRICDIDNWLKLRSITLWSVKTNGFDVWWNGREKNGCTSFNSIIKSFTCQSCVRYIFWNSCFTWWCC